MSAGYVAMLSKASPDERAAIASGELNLATLHNKKWGQCTGSRRDSAQWAIDKAGLVFEYRDMAVASVAGKLLRAVSLDPAFVATLVHD